MYAFVVFHILSLLLCPNTFLCLCMKGPLHFLLHHSGPSNPDVEDFMEDQGFGSDYSQLESYYINKLLNIVSNLPDVKNYIIWQEVFDNGCSLHPETVVNVWKDNYEAEMSSVTAGGFKAILSSCWYLNYISYGDDWTDYYQCDPLSFDGSPSQYDLVMGGSACMWAEWVDATNLISTT